MSFVIYGGCALKKKDSRELLPGEIVLNYGGEYHLVEKVAEQSEHVNLEIHPGFFKSYNLNEERMLTFLDRKADSKFLMLKIYRELLMDDQLSSVSISMLLLELTHHTAGIKYSDQNQWPVWVKITEDYLHEHWNSKFNLQDIAMIANAHPVTISKYFPNYFSCSVGEFVRKIKVEKALTLIKNSKQSLTAIAYECGFADQSHFIRTFKEYTGFAPFTYKRL